MEVAQINGMFLPGVRIREGRRQTGSLFSEVLKKDGIIREVLLDPSPHVRGPKIQEISSRGGGSGDTGEHRAR